MEPKFIKAGETWINLALVRYFKAYRSTPSAPLDISIDMGGNGESYDLKLVGREAEAFLEAIGRLDDRARTEEADADYLAATYTSKY